MAQKKLLFSLMIIFAFCFNAQGFEFKQEDIDFAKDLRKRTLQMNMRELKEKYYDLQDMLGDIKSDANSAYDTGEIDSNISLKIFVSSSMSQNLLKSYARSAKKYNATLVFRGLPQGSWKKLSDLVYEISEGEDQNIAMQIDDEAFSSYGVNAVPAIILAKEENALSENPRITFDKITGDILDTQFHIHFNHRLINTLDSMNIEVPRLNRMLYDE